MDSRFYHDNGDDLLKEYRQILKDIIIPRIPDLFTRIPNYPLEIVPLPHPGPGAQYIPASADGKRPGQFQVGLDLFRWLNCLHIAFWILSRIKIFSWIYIGHYWLWIHSVNINFPHFSCGIVYQSVWHWKLLSKSLFSSTPLSSQPMTWKGMCPSSDLCSIENGRNFKILNNYDLWLNNLAEAFNSWYVSFLDFVYRLTLIFFLFFVMYFPTFPKLSMCSSSTQLLVMPFKQPCSPVDFSCVVFLHQH